jgi:hypothetical protein
MRDIGDVRSSSTTGKKGSSYQWLRIVQNAMGLTTTAAHLRGYASTTEDLQLEVTVSSVINGSQFTIGWGKASVHDQLGARLAFMIS